MLTFAGYRQSGDVSTFFALAERNGWVSTETGRPSITQSGLAALGPYEPLPTGTELRRSLLNGSNLSTMEKALLRVLFDVYPQSITRATLHERASYKPSGDTSTALAKFVTLGYAEKYANGLRASEDLCSDERHNR